MLCGDAVGLLVRTTNTGMSIGREFMEGGGKAGQKSLELIAGQALKDILDLIV